MTTNWKRTESAEGAGAMLPGGVHACRADFTGAVICRALRWKMDAVCRDVAADPVYARADADAQSCDAAEAETDSTGSSLTRTIFFSSRIQTQPTTRKETHNTTQEKKGKKTQNTVTIRKKLETLA